MCFLGDLPGTLDVAAQRPEDALVKLLEVLSRRSQSLEVQDVRLGGDQLPRYLGNYWKITFF